VVSEPQEPEGYKLTPEQLKRRRMRSWAIAGGLLFLVVLFYIIAVAKMTGPAGHGG
jgi:hypothetical protein